MATSDCVKLGDFITLRNLKMDMYVSAEGIMFDDLFVTGGAASFDDNLFQVCLQRQYSAARELEEYMVANKDQPEFDASPLTNKYLYSLQKGRDNENKLNESYMSQKWGNKVFYGDIVQLLHVKSKKFLTVFPTRVSACERENLSMYLSAAGSPFSWLQILPRFKIDRRGDRILNEAEVLLKLSERSNEFVHCADRVRPGHPREINSSLEATSWRMKIFQNAPELADQSLLLPAQLFYIHDPETRANLALMEPPSDLALNDESTVDDDDDSTFENARGKTRVVIEPVIDSEPNSNALWYIEAKQLAVGTPVLYKSDSVRLRHFVTGKYLLLSKPANKNMQKNILNLEPYLLEATSDTNPVGSLMSLHQLFGSSNFLLNEKVVQLSCEHTYLERGEGLGDGTERNLCRGTRQKGSALNFVLKRYNPFSVQEGDTSSKALDVHICSSIKSYFVSVVANTVRPDLVDTPGIPLSTTIWPKANKDDLAKFDNISMRVLNYLEGFPISYDPSKDLVLLKNIPGLRNMTAQRKSLFRELGCIDVIFEIVNVLLAITENWFYHGWEAQTIVERIEPKKTVQRMVYSVTTQLMGILLECVRDHFTNQSFVASYIHIILSLVGREPLAAELISEMLSKNKELQETKIGRREVNLFVDQMKILRMNSMYLELLRACCSCQDRAVLKNQRLVCELLFPHLENVFLFLKAQHGTVDEYLQWPSSPVYPLTDFAEDSQIYAIDLLKGLPKVTLTWNSTATEFKVENLFGSNQVALDEVFRDFESRSVMIPGVSFKSVESSPMQQRKALVGKYLVNVVLLAAELCLDRFCTGISKFSVMFPYELLVGLLRSDHVSETMVSAVAKLLRNVHISQEPIPCDALPRTTRVWNTLEAEVNASLFGGPSMGSYDQSGMAPISHLPCVNEERINRHIVLQYAISAYLRDMRGVRRWEASSIEMVRLLHEMVKLRFYGTGPRLREIIRLIMHVLRRPRKTIEHNEMGIIGIQNAQSFFSRKSSRSLMEDNSEVSATSKYSGTTKDKNNIILDKPPRWEEAALAVLMSVRVLIAMLVLVVIAIALNGYVFLTGSTDPIFTNVDYGVTLVFIVELTLRTYCYFVVKGDMLNFYTDPFTIIDYTVVFLDILLFGLGSVLGAAGGFTKSLRLLRLLRLLRIMRAGRIIKSIVGIKDDDEMAWSMPVRYLEPIPHEIATMIELVKVLDTIQKIIEDRNITLLLTEFHSWVNEDGDHANSPGELFASLLPPMSDLGMNSTTSTEVFLDLMLYSSQPLCQGVHTILMRQHVSLAILLENARKVQLLVKPWREKQYRHIQSKIGQLEVHIEKHDEWGALIAAGSDVIAEETLLIVKELTETCRVRRRVMEFDETYKADKQAQNMLRASGCLRICNIIIEKLTSVGLDSLSDVGIYNTKLLSACNELLSWFLTENRDNQELAFPFFVDYLSTIDSGVGSHNVIKSLFKGNEKLMRLVPVSRISEFVELICDEGRFPQYLCLLGSIVSVGDDNIPENQYEIIRQMTIPTRVKKCLAFFCPVVSSEYSRKLKLMQPYLNKKDVEVDELPAELAYHLELLHVLSGCTEGDTNITTVETKVQGMYNYNDLVEALLDPNSLQIVRNRLALFFYNAMVDVEMVIPGFHRARSVWLFLESCVKIFHIAKDELRLIERQGWESPAAFRQRIEYMIICAMVVGGFFGRYFDPVVFYRDDGTNSADEEKLKPEQVNNLVVQLFDGIKALYDLDSPILSEKHKRFFLMALTELNKIKAIPSVLGDSVQLGYPARKDDDELDLVLSTGKESCAKIFRQFLDDVQSSDEANVIINGEFQSMIKKIEKLPSVKEIMDNVDERYEAIIQKMVSHARDSIYTVTHNMSPEKRMDSEETKTCIWVIRMFRTMIENRWGMTIYERDDDGGEEQDEACAELVGILNSRGATVLCLDLIAVGIDRELVIECIKLCVAMLFKEGGALEVQETMYNYLSTTDATLFFRQLRSIIRSLIEWHEKQGVVIKPSEERPLEPGEVEAEDIPQDIIVVRFMQLMCEGHYNPNQDIMREQKNSTTGSINMLDDLADYMISLVRMPCATSTEAALAVSATCLEVIQGPCEGNQEYFALNTQMIEMINRLMRMPAGPDATPEDEVELKKTGIDIIQGLLEGQAKKPAVYEKVLSVLHLDIIQLFCGGGDNDGEELSEEALSLQTECLVLIQMLCDFKPGLREELELPDLDSLVGSNVACVEIMWRGELQRRFFNVPDICSDLAKSAKDNLVEYVDRSSQENKLIDLLFRARGLYKEIQHQQTLRQYNLAGVFSRKNQDIATWFCFWIACAVNLIFLLYFHSDQCQVDPYAYDDQLAECKDPILATGPTVAAAALNYLQLFFSSFTLLLFLVVRVPVLFQSQLAQGNSPFSSAMTTALDPMTMYYFVYVMVASLGLTTRPLISFLLLDLIVKNSYARDVFVAIVFPWKALFMSTLLMGIVTFIFTYYFFIEFNTAQHLPFPEDCDNLWKCYLFILGYGKEGDISMYLENDSYNRWFYDFMYCLMLKFTLWNVVRGINVDTFAELRAIKMERLEDTTEVCFICGIDKLTFDRNDTNHGFAKHIRTEHNMWNYLYFFIYLWEQDKDDDDGMEQYVRRCIDANDIGWFPIGRALCLNADESDEVDEIAGQVRGDLINMNKRIISKINELEESIGNKVFAIDTSLNMNDDGSVASHESDANLSTKSMSAFKRLSSRPPSNKRAGSRSLPRSSTMNTREYAEKHSSQILMEPVELDGVGPLFDHRQHGKVSCRVSCKAGVYEIPRSMHKDGIHMKFDPNEVCVCSSLHPGINQQLEKVKVQIFIEDFGGIKKFIGALDIGLDELAAAATVRLEKTFIATFGGKSLEGKFVCLGFTMKHQEGGDANFMPGISLAADAHSVESTGTNTITAGGSKVLHKSRSSVV